MEMPAACLRWHLHIAVRLKLKRCYQTPVGQRYGPNAYTKQKHRLVMRNE